MSALFRRLRKAPPTPAPPADVVDFECNLCGHQNRGIPRAEVANREFQSCAACRSSLRMRALMYWLAMEVHGEARPFRNFPWTSPSRGWA